MSSNILGREVAKIALKQEGCKTGSKKHKIIVDTFNKLAPNGEHVSYSDAWCATFWTFCQIKAGMSHDDVPMGCNVPNIVEEAKKKGLWVEDDSHVPRIGDGLVYDWQDSGVGDNKGNPDHIGVIYKVTKTHIYIIEGNTTKRNERGQAVDTGVSARRCIAINNRYIRGFVCPRYNAILINIKAIEFSYGIHTSPKKYSVKTGKPRAAYRRAWKKFFPRKKVGSGCHQYVMVDLKSCGYKTMPLSWKSIFKYLNARFDKKPFHHKKSELRKGDVMLYKRVDSKGEHYHIWIIVEVEHELRVAEARQNKCYPYKRSNTKKALKTYTKTWLYRAKERL